MLGVPRSDVQAAVTWPGTFTNISGSPSGITSIATSADGSKVAIASSAGSVIRLSSDFGATWVSQGSTNPGTRAWFDLWMSPDGNTIYAVAAGLFYFTRDFGTTWNYVVPSPGTSSTSWNAVSASANGSLVVVGQGTDSTGPIVSTDSGATWTRRNIDTDTGPTYKGAVAEDGSFIVQTRWNDSSSRGLWVSHNAGVTWTRISSTEFSDIAISADRRTIVTTTRIGRKAHIFASADSFVTAPTESISATLGTNGDFSQDLIAISSDGQRVIVGGSPFGAGLHFSSDRGTTWATPLTSDVKASAASNDGYVVYVVRASGISRNAAITTANLSSSSPTDGATGVSPSGNITLTFDTNVEAVSGKSIRIVKTSDSTTTTIDAAHSSVTVSGTTVTIDPAADLADSTAYHLLIDAGAFRVAGGGADYRGIYTATELNFTTGLSDVTAPLAPGTPDLDAASDLGQSSTDDLTADNTPTITVVAAEAGGTVTVTAAKTGSSNVSCSITSGNSCTLGTLADGVWSLTAVHVDAAGNASTASSALSITIETVAPTRTAVSPVDGATGVSTAVSPTITFDDTVISGGGNIVIYSGASCATTVATIASSDAQVTISGSTVTINPAAEVDQNTKHCITYSASAFTDIAGNQVAALAQSAGDSDFSFTTAADVTAPAAPGRPDLATADDLGQSSTDNVTSVNTPSISVVAAEAGGTVTVTATKAGSSNVTCTLAGSTSGNSCTLGTLADGTWSLTAVHVDAAGNASSASSALSLTIDTVAPTISTYSPAQGATGVSRQPTLGMTFNEPVYASGVGRVRLRDYNSVSEVQTYAGNGSAVTISGATVTIDSSAMLATNSLHNIAIDFVSPTGVFVDLAGNSFAGISLNTTWQFTTTTDGTAPTATWSEPATPSSSRSLSFGLVFSESVSGLTSADFSNTGTATGCTISPSPSSGTTFTVSVTCSSDGTVILRLASGAVTDSVANEGPLTDTDATSVTIASPPPAAPTTTTTIPSTARTLSITGAASSYLVTQTGPGLTAAPSAGGGAISWSSLTPGVCSIGSVAMMSILSKQSSVSVGRLNTVGTCSIRATIAATTTHDAASSTVSFAVTRIRPTLRLAVRDLSPEDQFFLRITLPSAVASNVTLLEQMYAAVNFESTTPDACEVDIITAYDESIARYGSAWAGVHVSVNRFGGETCGVQAELPLGVRWFRVSSDPATMTATSTATTPTTVSPTTTVGASATTAPGSSTTVAGSAVTVATTAPSSATTTPSGEPSLTSFAPTPTTVPVIELDLAAQIIVETDVTRIVISGDSIESSARDLGVTTGLVRIRPNTGDWTQVSLPRPTDVTIVLTAETTSLDVRFEPLDGAPILVSVPLAIVVNDSRAWLFALVAFVLGSGATVMWFAAAKRRRRKELPPPVA